MHVIRPLMFDTCLGVSQNTSKPFFCMSHLLFKWFLYLFTVTKLFSHGLKINSLWLWKAHIDAAIYSDNILLRQQYPIPVINNLSIDLIDLYLSINNGAIKKLNPIRNYKSVNEMLIDMSYRYLSYGIYRGSFL